MTTTPDPSPAAQPNPPTRGMPTVGWAVRRAVFGLVIMLAMTTVAAYLAQASIDTPAEPAPTPITIGVSASALLK
jgi:hypothetical protein